MYGLINRAMQEFVVTSHGAPKWDAIRTMASVEVTNFDGMQHYPDWMTYALIEAATKELDEPAEQILGAFGEYWVLYTAKEGWEDLLKVSGSDFVSLLQNLDLLHARISRSYPELKPPAFQCTDRQPGSLLLHYRSDRAGLTPFVVGLVKGVGKMFQTDVRVKVVSEKSQGADHDVFHVEYEPHD